MFKVRFGRTISGCVALAVVALFLTLALTHAGRAKPRPAPPVSIDVTHEAIKPGNYATAINIHNPSPEYTVDIYAKAVLDGGQPSGYKMITLAPDYAVEYSCYDIEYTLLGANGGIETFQKGYVVFFVNGAALATAAPALLPVDVVGVYTSEPPETSFSGTAVIPGIAERLVPVAARLEIVSTTSPAVSAGLPAGRYYEYAAKFLCGNTAGPTP